MYLKPNYYNPPNERQSWLQNAFDDEFPGKGELKINALCLRPPYQCGLCQR